MKYAMKMQRGKWFQLITIIAKKLNKKKENMMDVSNAIQFKCIQTVPTKG